MKMKKRARLFKGLHVTFILETLADTDQPVSLQCEWDPGIPDPNPRLEKRYRQERDKFLAEVSGGTFAVAEI